jgi:glycosyltransferase involved in cell wall biosynthesis
VIPNYVDIDHFRPADRPQEKEFDLVFVGRIKPQKNIEAMLKALQSLDVRLLLIGSGELEDTLKQRFGDLDGRIIWQGNVPNAELPEYLNRARVFILPSLYEGHPKTLIEAMSCGLPVIGADSPGLREIIRRGATGWLCGTDATSIRDAIQHLLDNPALCTQLGQNARQYVLEHYALDHIAQLEYQLIQEVISR